MRRSMKLLIMAGLLVVVSAVSSWAASTYISGLPAQVPITLKFYNYDIGTTYSIADTGSTPYTTAGAINAIPGQVGPTGAVGAEDSWGLLQLTEIDLTGPNTPLWKASSSDEVTGMFWGGTDNYLGQITSGTSVTQEIGASGFHVALWEDTTPDFSAGAGPGGRSNPANALPTYATATDGTLIWTLNSTPGYDTLFDTTLTRDFLANYTVNTKNGKVSGGGGFYANTGGITEGSNTFTGSLNGLLANTSDGVTMEVNFTNSNPPSLPPYPNGWEVQSSDPAYSATTPELSSSVLMLLGLIPIGLGWRKHRKA
jgi:hypothetical protein